MSKTECKRRINLLKRRCIEMENKAYLGEISARYIFSQISEMEMEIDALREELEEK